MADAPLRVGIVGARRIRQGLGPFVARDLTALGAQVTHVLGRSRESAEAAAASIQSIAGVEAAPLTDPRAFDAAPLDVVCVLTPKGHHLQWVERALAAGRHVLVEKPLIWHGPDTAEASDWGEIAGSLEERFAAGGLILGVNAQWPWTLPAFRELHGAKDTACQRLAMGLAPVATSASEMIGDALPHALSMALELRPDLVNLEGCSFTSERPGLLSIRAELQGPRGPLILEAQLDSSEAGGPRDAWYAVDGARVDRCVRTEDYALFLRAGSRIVNMPDPLRARIAAFIRQVDEARQAGCPQRPPQLPVSLAARWLQRIDGALGDRAVEGL